MFCSLTGHLQEVERRIPEALRQPPMAQAIDLQKSSKDAMNNYEPTNIQDLVFCCGVVSVYTSDVNFLIHPPASPTSPKTLRNICPAAFSSGDQSCDMLGA